MSPSPARDLTVRTAPEESDVALALVRTAFIVAFTVLASAVGAEFWETVPAWAGVVLAACFTIVYFLIWWKRRAPMPVMRALTLVVDLLMISGVIASFGYDASGVKDCYYVVIFAAGMWFRLPGAIALGCLSAVAYIVAYTYGTGSSFSAGTAVALLWGNGALVFPIAGGIMGYLFNAYAAEMRKLAEIEHEIDLARSLQDAMLPADRPQVSGWQIAAAMKRAREVGGDLYVFHRYPDGKLLLAVADMAGKSVYGLVHLSLLHSHLLAAARASTDLAGLARELNRRAYPELQPDSYAAVVLLLVAPNSGEVAYVNCGHLPPVAVSPDGELQVLATGDPIIGATSDPEYHVERLVLGEGSLV
ncbi:MAG: SpoIIE family protein phosphatase, partial [Armatimonadetes bacterium]|nr:SpoIIE family protein phosphatase [Armatimonadota bacterium]